MLRIVFMGTPEFSVPILEALIKEYNTDIKSDEEVDVDDVYKQFTNINNDAWDDFDLPLSEDGQASTSRAAPAQFCPPHCLAP